MTITERSEFGHRGERYVRARLERAGWSFVAANWHCRAGELDLIMRDGETLVFVEVKTRQNDRAGWAEESISTTKGRRLLAAAEWFVADHPELGDPIWRIDLVAVTADRQGVVARFNHIANAVLSG